MTLRGKDCYDAGGVCGPWDKNGVCTKCREKTRLMEGTDV